MKRITNFGNGLYHILDGAKIRNQTNGMFPCIGIYSKNCPEYVIAEYGCYWQSLVVVPIYDTLGPHACSFISNQGKNFSIERFIKKIYFRLTLRMVVIEILLIDDDQRLSC